jgi:hypothetical protein
VRRSPRWVLEGIAWSSAATFVAGIAVVALGVVGTKTVYAETPVVTVTAPATTPTLAPPKAVAPTPAKRRPAAVKPRVHTGVPIETSLGAPPGPQNDIAPTAFAAPENRYAFLAGVTRYRKPTHDTIAGAQDVVFLRSMLIASGWLPQNIRIVTNSQATGAAMREGLTWLAARSTPGTFTFFHFSGHVKQAGGHEKLWPYDRDFIPDTQLASILSRGTGKLWMDIAGCEAAGFIEDLPSARVLVSTSSKSTQKSYEYPQWGESVYTGLTFDLGMSQMQADANHNGTTTVGEALRFSQYYAQSITLHQTPYGRQTPQYSGMNDILGWTLDNPPA